MQLNYPTNRTVNQHETASEAALLAVASHLTVDPMDLTPPLYAGWDPEALDKLVPQAKYISFRYMGCEVVVIEGTRIEVRSVNLSN